MIDLTTPRTLAEALRVLRKDWLHDYDTLAEGPAQDRVLCLGIWDEEIPLLLQMVPRAKVEKLREGTEGFWRVNVTVEKGGPK